LLQTRFGTGISLQVNIAEPYDQYLIPPLTLQLLVENAVKHNQVSPSKPLKVEIQCEGGTLIVQNNKQPKRAAASHGTGLSNISAKYKLLNQPDIFIRNEEDRFTVKVPLIKPASI
jgi:LytS/YehU family sensor histidine kinase